MNATQRNDYRGITAQVQTLRRRARTARATQLVRTQLPFDVTSEGTLTGDIGGAELRRSAALHHRAGAQAAMNFTREELKKLALPLLAALALLGAGAALDLARATQSLASATSASSPRRRPSAGRAPSASRASPRRSAR